MAKFVRKNAWNNGGTFDNADLLWYARGVGVMQGRKLDDPSSWWFFAAIHGEFVTPASLKQKGAFPWKDIPPPGSVPNAPLPPPNVSDEYWDQCQHQTWYFTPWHRGYLLALEAQVRAAIKTIPGSPPEWALPYWDYFGAATEYDIPPAFTQKDVEGKTNPLYIQARYGPEENGDIYVPTPAWIKQHPNDPPPAVTERCMSDDLYTGSDSKTKPPGFGGPETGFSHSGGPRQPFGNLENQPHNHVHVYVGESSPNGKIPGLMSVPALAALDPIFYLHHANIDRMWASWNQTNSNPTDPKWLNGPADRKFIMPMPGDKKWVYTPKDMSNLDALDYTYDSLQKPAPAVDVLGQRLARLGASAAAAGVKKGVTVTASGNEELMGASQQPLPIKGTGASTSVKLDPGVRGKVSASLAEASEAAPPDRVFLELESVRGTQDATVLSVYINLPEGAKPGDHPELLAGSVALFGLTAASDEDGSHAGQGLNFVLDITNIVDRLHLQNALNVNSLNVRIVPHHAIPDEVQITVGRVSIYREGQ